MKLSANTQYELCVGGVSLCLQSSYEDIDKTQPQWKERHRLVMRPAIFLVEFSLQQNLKNTESVRLATLTNFKLCNKKRFQGLFYDYVIINRF